MAYVPFTWVDGETPITADRLNHVEGGVEAVSLEVESVLEDTVDIIAALTLRVEALEALLGESSA